MCGHCILVFLEYGKRIMMQKDATFSPDRIHRYTPLPAVEPEPACMWIHNAESFHSRRTIYWTTRSLAA